MKADEFDKRFEAGEGISGDLDLLGARRPLQEATTHLAAGEIPPIDSGEDLPGTQTTPRVRSLIGSLKGATTTEEDYRRHLEDKYR